MKTYFHNLPIVSLFYVHMWHKISIQRLSNYQGNNKHTGLQNMPKTNNDYRLSLLTKWKSIPWQSLPLSLKTWCSQITLSLYHWHHKGWEKQITIHSFTASEEGNVMRIQLTGCLKPFIHSNYESQVFVNNLSSSTAEYDTKYFIQPQTF